MLSEHFISRFLLPTLNMAPMPSTLLSRPHSRKSLSSCQSVEFELSSRLLRWTPSAPLYEQLNIATPLKRFEYKLIYFTYRCTHSLASTLLVNQYIILSQSKSRTSSLTRGQSSVKLALCNVKTRSGSVSPLFTSSLLWNSLPSALRQPDLSSSQFSHLLYLSGVFVPNNAQAPSLFSNVTLTSRRS